MRLRHVAIRVGIQVSPGADVLRIVELQAQRQGKRFDVVERQSVKLVVGFFPVPDDFQGMRVIVDCLDFRNFRKQRRVGRRLRV